LSAWLAGLTSWHMVRRMHSTAVCATCTACTVKHHNGLQAFRNALQRTIMVRSAPQWSGSVLRYFHNALQCTATVHKPSTTFTQCTAMLHKCSTMFCKRSTTFSCGALRCTAGTLWKTCGPLQCLVMRCGALQNACGPQAFRNVPQAFCDVL